MANSKEAFPPRSAFDMVVSSDPEFRNDISMVFVLFLANFPKSRFSGLATMSLSLAGSAKRALNALRRPPVTHLSSREDSVSMELMRVSLTCL